MDRKDLHLEKEGQALLVRCNGIRQQVVPMKLLERVVVHQDTQLTTNVLIAMVRNRVSLVVLSRKGEIAQVLGSPHNDSEPRLAQYTLFEQPMVRRRLSGETVLARLKGEHQLLESIRAYRGDSGRALASGLELLGPRVDRLEESFLNEKRWPEIQKLRGIEGAAAAVFFRSFQTVFPPAFGFNARRRRPPPDPVNAVLSLGYTLLHVDAVRSLWGSGLDPWVGYFHEPSYGRESLASDLIEHHRHRIEEWAWELFRERTLTRDHFSERDGGCFLGKEGRKRFYACWEMRARGLRRLLRIQSYGLAKRLSTLREERGAFV